MAKNDEGRMPTPGSWGMLLWAKVRKGVGGVAAMIEKTI